MKNKEAEVISLAIELANSKSLNSSMIEARVQSEISAVENTQSRNQTLEGMCVIQEELPLKDAAEELNRAHDQIGDYHTLLAALDARLSDLSKRYVPTEDYLGG